MPTLRWQLKPHTVQGHTLRGAVVIQMEGRALSRPLYSLYSWGHDGAWPFTDLFIVL